MKQSLKKTIKSLTILCLVFSCIVIASTAPSYAAGKPLSGKSVLIEGDSLQYGFGKYVETGIKWMGPKKVKNIAKNNAALGYSPVGNVKNCSYWRLMHLSVKEMRKYDYIIIASGTNDYFSGYRVAPGNVTSKSERTTAGALGRILWRIKKNSPHTKVVVVTPIARFSHKTGDCDKRKNRYGKTLKDYRDVITAVAQRYDNTYIIQGTDLANVKEMKLRRNSSDGIHPKKKFARNVVAKRFNRKFRATVLAPPKPEPKAGSAAATSAPAPTATEPAPAATSAPATAATN